MRTFELIHTLENQGLYQNVDKIKTKTNLYKKPFNVFFLRTIVKIDSNLPNMGDFYNTNKLIIEKYRTAIKIIKAKIKKSMK